jgi:exosome complex component RRP43
MIDLKELSLVSGKAAWMAYLVGFYLYCIYQISVNIHRNNVLYGARYFIFICFDYVVINLLNELMQDIYCLDADGALFDVALLSAVAALSHCK